MYTTPTPPDTGLINFVTYAIPIMGFIAGIVLFIAIIVIAVQLIKIYRRLNELDLPIIKECPHCHNKMRLKQIDNENWYICERSDCNYKTK